MTRIFIVFVVFIGSVFQSLSQEVDTAFKQMIEQAYSGLPLIMPNQLSDIMHKASPVVILDTREKKEFDVSHLPNAIHFGYDHKNLQVLKGLSKSTPIIVYCSIGVRSQNIGKELVEMGFLNVSNLYGGIFLWGNQEREMRDSLGKTTTFVHGYNPYWGKWLKNNSVVYN